MTRIANRFTDPRTAASYDWPLNYSEEEGFGKRRNITHGANTGQTGLVKQQGDDEPLIWKVRGSILTEAMLIEIWRWWQLSKSQTIYFRDFAGDEYEVIFTSFEPTRKRVLRNPKDPTNAPNHYWTYEIEMEVIRIISGPLATSGVSP
jgi:hypothetical protein